MKIFSFLPILLVILTSAHTVMAEPTNFEKDPSGQNLQYKKVAIAIAGPGHGASVMGHAFLLFLTETTRLSESFAVQFNVLETAESSEKSNPVLGFLGFGKRFSVEATYGLSMMNRYSLENRGIILYILDLQPKEISDLWTLLGKEYFFRKNNIQTDYNFLSRNCLTESLRYLNQVIPEEKNQFSFLDDSAKIGKVFTLLVGPGAYARNAPYIAAPKLAKNPLVSKTLVIPPAIVTNAKLYVRLQESTQTFAKACGYEEQLSEVATKLAGQPRLRESKAYLELLRRINDKCNSETGKLAYAAAMESLYFLADSLESKMRIESYLQ